MRFNKARKYQVPIIGLFLTTLLLFMIVGSMTVLNYNRERKLMIRQLNNQGLTLLQSLEAGARVGMQEMMWGRDQIQLLLTETAKGPNVARIWLVDKQGQIVFNDDPQRITQTLTDFKIPDSTTESFLVTTKVGTVFRLIKPFGPWSQGEGSGSGQSDRWMRWMWQSDAVRGPTYLVLDLTMDEYEESQQQDIHMAIISSIILLVLGSGSFYFLLIAQNYRTVQNTLQSMESYTQRIVESMPNGLITLDQEGRIQSINRNAVRLLQLGDEPLLNKQLSDVMTNCNLPKTFMPEIDVQDKQVDCQLNNGELVPLSTTTSELKDAEGQPVGIVIMLKDLRDIRSLEKRVELSERLASLGQMAAGIAHEIRNPLSSIKGFAQYFRNKFPQGSDECGYAKVIIEEVDLLNRVIEDMLNFAKPRELELQEINPIQLLENCLKLIRSDILNKKIQVKRKYVSKQPVAIVGDQDLLNNVLLNLLINALEAMEKEGQMTLSIDQEPGNVVIGISDTGCGIPQEKLKHIFDPFFTSKKGGTGLGLAIVYRIIEMHNGEIKVRSEVGFGTAVRVILPESI